MRSKKAVVCFLAWAVVAGPLASRGRSQQMTSFERDRTLQMLDDIAHDVQEHSDG